MTAQQFDKIRSGSGFIAALDQSGGSTPTALQQYGVNDDAYSNDDEMFARMHEMRSRIVTSPSFGGDRISGAILFGDTVAREIAGRPSVSYLWEVKGVVPFLKVDEGLAAEVDGAQIMKPLPALGQELAGAKEHNVFGTKMRSFIKLANPAGVRAVVDQQFEMGRQILATGLLPILEPEIDIHTPERAEAEGLLRTAILEQLDSLAASEHVILKLTLPEVADFYSALVTHPNVLRVVALSGGYGRDEANARLTRNHGVVASFSRALTEGLSVDQSEEVFDAILDRSITDIWTASQT